MVAGAAQPKWDILEAVILLDGYVKLFVFPFYQGGTSQPPLKNCSRFRVFWEVKCNEKNTATKELWNKVTAEYHPKTTHLNEAKTILLFNTT